MHEREGAFVIPNPWDIGSARLLAGLGFEALATTSAGFARAMGKMDYRVGRSEVGSTSSFRAGRQLRNHLASAASVASFERKSP